MTCYHPIDAWRIAGESKLKFYQPHRADIREKLQVPCGQCIGCRLERSRQWAIRCIHEAQMHKDNCFITLTFAPEFIPDPPTLDVRDFQLFMKRLRKKFGGNIRFFHCGEYGEKHGRPHYHACLFGFNFPDRVLYSQRNGVNLYVSESLSKLWPFGFSTIGDVTFESAAYVARYVLKKVTGKSSEDHYTYISPNTGEISLLKPEYVTMSRRPGIAYSWYQKFSSDVFPSDFIVVNRRKMRPPRYYDKQLQNISPLDYEEIHFARYQSSLLHLDNNTPDRLLVREEVQAARLSKLPRTLEA